MALKDKTKRSEYNKQWKEKHKGRCVDCGKLIQYESTRCRHCALVYTWKIGARKPTAKGSRHGNWRGGKYQLKSGYVFVKSENHPRANKNGYVLEHILIWEQTHNKPLPAVYIIHHLNGIKDDNRPQNLVALPNKKHYLVLAAKAKRIQELEALLNHQNQLL